MEADDDVNTSGWDAIDRALKPIYGDLEPKHWGTIVRYSAGGRDPLDGTSAYPANDPPHWHFVTFGMTELYSKVSKTPEESGWGYEFTFRLARKKKDKVPPIWALNFLQNMARYVFNSHNSFEDGHAMHLNGAIALGEKTDIQAIIIVRDPQLSETQESPNGKFSFLQFVGITTDEHTLTGEWSVKRLAEWLAKDNPLLVTDLARKSLLSDKGIAAKIRKQVKKEGSSRGGLYVDKMSWTRTSRVYHIMLGALTADGIGGILRGRLNFGRPLILFGKTQSVHFAPAEKNRIKIDGDQLILNLTPELSAKIAADLVPKRGTLTWPELKSLVVEVEPTEIWDEKREKVLSVIG